MANIVVSRPWTRQPPYLVPIDKGHPLSSGLVSVALQSASTHHGAIDAAAGRNRWPIANAISAAMGYTDRGYSFGKPTATGAAWANASGDIPLNPKSGCTIIAMYRPISSTPAAVRAIVGFGTSGSNTPFFQIAQTTSSAGHLNLQFRDDASAMVNISSTQQMLADKWYTFGIWTDGVSNHGVRINGVSYTSATTLGAFTTPTFCTLMGLNRVSLANIADGDLIGPWFYNRMLSIAEIDSMIANPWQVFQPQRRFWPSFDAANPDVTDALTGSAVTPGHGTASPVFSIGL